MPGFLHGLDRLPAGVPQPAARRLWAAALGSLVIGVVAWATGTLQGGFIALWAYALCAVAVALVLPFPYAFASPLFVAMAGWTVDMLPFTILLGWLTVVARWGVVLLRERRMPQVGRFVWLPIGLLFWTGLGVIVITTADFKHFFLLFGIQVLSSATILAVAEQLGEVEARARAVGALVVALAVYSLAVTLQWFGVNLDAVQNRDVAVRAEAAYGVDAFPNQIGMVKYARAQKSGAGDLRARLRSLRERNPEMPEFSVYRPKFKAYETELLVRFDRPARHVEHELAKLDVALAYDSIGFAPSHNVPRMRSFPRNALTYAGMSAAVFPLAFFLAWRGRSTWRRRLGWAGVAACLFGAGFALARGAWLAILIGVVYLAVDGRIEGRRKIQVAAAFLAGALVLAGVYLVKYRSDPLTARAGGEASVQTRTSLYADTIASLNRIHYVVGFGTEKPRSPEGRAVARFIPAAGTHSTYLNYLFRTGVPGVLMLTVIYFTAWLHARARNRLKTADDGVFAALAAAAVVIVAAHGAVLSLYVEPAYTITVSIVLGLALAGLASLSGSMLPWRVRTRG